jgi:hypothetical protein
VLGCLNGASLSIPSSLGSSTRAALPDFLRVEHCAPTALPLCVRALHGAAVAQTAARWEHRSRNRNPSMPDPHVHQPPPSTISTTSSPSSAASSSCAYASCLGSTTTSPALHGGMACEPPGVEQVDVLRDGTQSVLGEQGVR